MAVRHGYGKIAGTDALVFAYDTGDTRNSYKGEPTTNIIADPLYALGTKTAYYDTNNTGWGTVTRGRIEEVIGPFGKPVQAYSQELISYNSSNRNMEGQPQEVVNNANCLANLISGVTYRISVWIKATYTGTSQNRLYLSGTAAVGDSDNRQVTTEWQRFSKTYTPSTSGAYYMRHYDYSGGKAVGAKIWYAHLQVEVDKGHATQFTTGTRSATQGLVDLTGNSTIDLANVSFDSNANPAWDGTGDYIRGSIDPTLLQGAYTIEVVFKHLGTSQWEAIWSNNVTATNWSNSVTLAPILTFNGSSYPTTQYQIGHNAVGVAGTGVFLDLTAAHMNRYVHVCLTRSGTTLSIYANWEGTSLFTSGEYTAYAINPKDNYIVGRHWYNNGGATQTFNGEIPVVKIYNRALTAAEVRNNYNQYKGRFNI